MFFDTIAMSEGIKIVEEHLGPQGRMFRFDDPQYETVGLYTHILGKFWYGALSITEERSKLQKIAEALKETLYVVPDTMANDIRSFPEQALLEVQP
jgi:hypothetical protein